MRHICFKVPDDLATTVEAEARRMGISKSELVRRALLVYLTGRLTGQPRRVKLS